MKISACMIAKNEEDVIARCIESYLAIVDEVIVVDTGSTDKTADVAKSLGAKIFHYSWNDDFAAAKNFAISKTKGDWIIFLDADEYFAPHAAQNVRSFLRNLDKSINSVACRMINIDNQSGKVLDELTHVRIFKNDKKIIYVNPIHEMLQHSGKGKKMHALFADPKEILIYHTGYSYNNRQEKAQRNLALLLKELPQAPNKPAYYQYISDCYFGLEDWENVIKYTYLFMDSGAKLIGYNVRPHQNLIDAMLRLKYSTEEIIGEIDKAIERYSFHPLFHFYKANLFYDLKKYDAAFAEYQETLKLHEAYNDMEINSLPVNLWLVFNSMGAICEHRNEYSMAVEYYLKSLKLDKDNEPCFDRLMMLIRTQPEQDIIFFLNTIYNVDSEAELDFLATRLVNHAVPRVLAYYTNLREKKYAKQDYVVLQMLVANKQYAKAFPTLLECYMQDGDGTLATVAATAALLSNDEQYIALCLHKLPLSLTKVIKAYRGETVSLNQADKHSFLSLMHTFILWADEVSLRKLLTVGSRFAGGMAAELGSAFVKEGFYQNAIYLYQDALKNDSYAQHISLPTLYLNIGYCYHRLDDSNSSSQALVKAYEAGYRANDIYEFLRWNLAKLGEAITLKETIKKILQNVDSLKLVH